MRFSVRTTVMWLLLSACREPPSTSVVVIPRAPVLPAEETSRVQQLMYAPTDLALGWRGADSLVVGHIESYASGDVEGQTCTGTGLFAVPFTTGGGAREIRTGAPVCAALTGGNGIAVLPRLEGIIYSSRTSTNSSRLVRLDFPDAAADTISGACAPYSEEPAVSPDGRWIAIKGLCEGRRQKEWGVYVRPLSGGAWRRVAGGDSVSAVMPSWSPDGRALAVRLGDATDSARTRRLAVVELSSGALRALAHGSSPSWSPDGQWIAFIGANAGGEEEIRIIRPDSGATETLFRNETRTTYVRGFGPMREGAPRPPLLWTPDASGLVFGRAFDRGVTLWQMEIGAGQPRQITEAAQR